jgi:hypothetical protein
MKLGRDLTVLYPVVGIANRNTVVVASVCFFPLDQRVAGLNPAEAMDS